MARTLKAIEQELSEVLEVIKAENFENRSTGADPITRGYCARKLQRLELLRSERADAIAKLERVETSLKVVAAQVDQEDAKFWFRRFFVTLAIANAAGFGALTTGLFQAADRGAIALLIAPSITSFAWGMLFAGAIPLFLWLRSDARASVELVAAMNRGDIEQAVKVIQRYMMIVTYLATAASVASFSAGLFQAVSGINRLSLN